MIKGWCDRGFIWNPSNCDCERDKPCDVGQYLDNKKCRCRKKIIGKLVEEFCKNIYENAMIYNGTLNNYKRVCSSSTVYIVLIAIFLIICISIGSVLVFKKEIIIMLKQYFIECNSTEYINDNLI